MRRNISLSIAVSVVVAGVADLLYLLVFALNGGAG
jgi:hypothetical protein